MPVGADRRLFGCGNYCVQILGSLAFLLAAGDNVPLLLLGVVLFGAGIGNTTSLPPLIAQAVRQAGCAARRSADRRDRPGHLCVRTGYIRFHPRTDPAVGVNIGGSCTLDVYRRSFDPGIRACRIPRRAAA
jgi:hypothetical protein